MKTIGVYLGANFGNDLAFEQTAVELAHEIVDNQLTLIYGGSSLGMMGLLAKAVKNLNGRVIGVITHHLIDKEMPLKTLDELRIVGSMQERKKLLQELSDAFIVMPGGLGALDEAIETWNAIKIGELNKKIGFLNINNYFEKLFDFVEHCRESGFVSPEQSQIPLIDYNPRSLLDKLIKMTHQNILPVKKKIEWI